MQMSSSTETNAATLNPLREYRGGAAGVEDAACSEQTLPVSHRQKVLLAAQAVYEFVDKQFFLVFVIASILLAAATPSVGKDGGVLSPEITTGYVATIIIFLISGMTLNTTDFIVAIKNVRLNVFVFLYNMCAITLMMWGVAGALRNSTFSDELLDGFVILGTLPTSVSMCVILTTASSGDAAAALFNATALNIWGIFLTPAWLLGLLAAHSSVSTGDVILKLVIKVVLPLIFGQMIRYIPHPSIGKEIKARKAALKRTQDICLCCIIYTTFCDTFAEGTDATWADLISTFFLVLFLLLVFMLLAWGILGLNVMQLTKAQRVAGLYASTHKTVALGIPLISAIYEGSDNVGIYSIPLLMYHPLQLIVGSFIVPRLKEFVEAEEPLPTQEQLDDPSVSAYNTSSTVVSSAGREVASSTKDFTEEEDISGVGL